MFFQIEKEEEVILDCEYFFNLDIVINNDGDVDGVVSFTKRFNRW
jgi:hypothetical protein